MNHRPGELLCTTQFWVGVDTLDLSSAHAAIGRQTLEPASALALFACGLHGIDSHLLLLYRRLSAADVDAIFGKIREIAKKIPNRDMLPSCLPSAMASLSA